MQKTAVVLLNLGGPNDPAGIKPFLYNLFSDHDIFNFPFGQKFIARMISSLRIKSSAEKYKLIGGSSPIGRWTEIQRRMLEKELQASYPEISVFTAMRYTQPDTAETVRQIAEGGFDKVILLPLYPQYSFATTVSSFNEWKRNAAKLKARQIFINDFYRNTDYINAVTGRIIQTASDNDVKIGSDCAVIFSAHSTPVSMKEKGDPYSEQIQETAKAIALAGGISEYKISYQSKVGPVKWLEPSTESIIEEMAGKGFKTIIAVPVSFVSDHLETLYDLGIYYKNFAEAKGIKNFYVTGGLNDSSLFILALKEEVMNKLQ
jgi:ferrochelatase